MLASTGVMCMCMRLFIFNQHLMSVRLFSVVTLNRYTQTNKPTPTCLWLNVVRAVAKHRNYNVSIFVIVVNIFVMIMILCILLLLYVQKNVECNLNEQSCICNLNVWIRQPIHCNYQRAHPDGNPIKARQWAVVHDVCWKQFCHTITHYSTSQRLQSGQHFLATPIVTTEDLIFFFSSNTEYFLVGSKISSLFTKSDGLHKRLQ